MGVQEGVKNGAEKQLSYMTKVKTVHEISLRDTKGQFVFVRVIWWNRYF